MELFTIFVLYIYSNTTLNMEESKERAYNACTSVYWDVSMSGKDTVQEVCGGVWNEVYGYEKK